MMSFFRSIIQTARRGIWKMDSIWTGRERKYWFIYKFLLRISPRELFKSADGRIVIRDQIENGRPVRRLQYDNIGQSAFFLDKNGDSEPLFAYMQTLKELALGYDGVKNILLIGGGGFSFPRYFLNAVPDGMITVIEIDRKFYEIAKKYFFLDDEPRMRVMIQDGLSYLSDTVSANASKRGEYGTISYDMVILDAFIGPKLVRELHTESAYRLVKSVLASDGLLGINLLNKEKNAIPLETHCSQKMLNSLFKNTKILQCPQGWNHILLASDRMI